MKGTSSCAKSDIPTKIFKECKYSLSIPLQLFWQKSLNSGQIPQGYKNQTTVHTQKGTQN